MNPTSLVVSFVVLVIGVSLGWLIRGLRAAADRATADAATAASMAAATARREEAQRRVAELEAEAGKHERALDQARADITALREAQAQLTTTLDAERRATAEKLALLNEAETKLREAFGTLSADALKSNNQAFPQLARTALGEYQQVARAELDTRRQAVEELVKPLRVSLEKVDAKLQDVEKSRVEAASALNQQLRTLVSMQQGLQQETTNLVRALREPAVRGSWGEIQLRRVVEMAGMLDHCDFYEQQSNATEQGRQVPDLVVRLPGDRAIVVDSKAPLAAYLQAVDAPDEGTREARLKEHARQVRQHMAKLAGKAYWENLQPAPEFVVMFLPGEMLFSTALLHDPQLIEVATDHRVILASPITLIALLRVVAFGWNQHRMEEGTRQVSELGRQLYDRVVKMAEHLEKVGANLDNAVQAYNQAIGSIESRVLVSARRFKDLGVGVAKEVPTLEPIDHTVREIRFADGSVHAELPLNGEVDGV